jgi:hypothetical protein
MMSVEELRSIVRDIVQMLVKGDYEQLVRRCTESRLTSGDLGAVIRQYGRELVVPPSDAYENLDAVQVKGALVPTWSVRAPLWTKDEGRSDLTLDLTIALGPGEPRVEIDDLHVL